MTKELPTTIVEQSREDATESAAQHYDIEAYMRAGRTCVGITRALGRALCTNPTELPPLYTAVECDALEQLFRPRRDGHTRTNVSITFTYDRYTVTLTANGHLILEE